MEARDALIAPADAYFQALMGHDGHLFPHQEGCERVENGHRVTHLPVPPTVAGTAPPLAYGGTYGDCGADFQAFAHTIIETAHRRYPLVDREQGVVLGQALFHRPPEATIPRNLVTEYFYMKDGKVTGIWMVGYLLPKGIPDRNGWDVGDHTSPSPPADPRVSKSRWAPRTGTHSRPATTTEWRPSRLGIAQAMRMAGHSKADMTLLYTLEDHEAQQAAVEERQKSMRAKVARA